MNIMDTNATRSVADGADKSVSFSFTSAGKALTSRSKPSNSKAASSNGSSTAGAGSAGDLVNGVAVRKGMDILTVDDVSEHEPSQSFLDDGDKLGELPRVDGAAVPRGAGATNATKSAGATNEAPPMVSAQFKMVDAGLKSIITDMVKAIEVAVWDAAMER